MADGNQGRDGGRVDSDEMTNEFQSGSPAGVQRRDLLKGILGSSAVAVGSPLLSETASAGTVEGTVTCSVTEVAGQPPLSDYPALVRIESGDTQNTGTGPIQIDDSSVDSESDIGIFDTSGNMLPYSWVRFDPSSGVYEAWVRGDFTRDGTDQLEIRFGNDVGSSETMSTVFGGVPNLLLRYGLEESSGSAQDDADGRTGRVYGATQGVDSPILSKGYSFDGTDDYMVLEDSIPRLDNSFTIESWLVPRFSGKGKFIQLGDNNNTFLVTKDDDDTLEFVMDFGNDIADSFQRAGENGLSAGQAYHAAGRWDKGQELNFVRDGQQRSRTEIGDDDMYIQRSQDSIARDASSPNAYFDGIASEVRVYDEYVTDAWLRADYDITSKAAYAFFSQTSGDSEQNTPLIEIEKIRPVQVVFETGLGNDDRLDLVENKNIAVLVYPSGENLSELSGNVTFTLLSEQSDPVSSSAKVTLSADEYRQAANKNSLDSGYIELFSTANGTGDKKIRVQIETADETAEISNDNQISSTSVTNRTTKEFDLAFYRMDPIAINSDDAYSIASSGATSTFIDRSTTFVKGTFPVASDKFSSQLQGDVPGEETLKGTPGLNIDIVSLQAAAFKDTDGARGVGVTDESYWTYHNKSAAGFMNPYMDSVLVRAGFPVSLAHELGHTFGLHTGTEEYDIDSDSDISTNSDFDDKGDGYWVENKNYIKNSTAFMGAVSNTPFSQRSSQNTTPPQYDRWINNEKNSGVTDFKDYDEIFDKLLDESSDGTSESSSDSESVFISGLIGDDNVLEPKKWYFSKEGTDISTESGEYEVVIRDKTDEALVREDFSVSFKGLFVSSFGPDSPVELDQAPFGFSVAYPEEARSVEIQKDGTVLNNGSFELGTKLLLDAVESIPDNGFKSENPRGNRIAIKTNIEKVQDFLSRDQTRRAVRHLDIVVRRLLEELLKDDYEVNSPLEISKEEILSLLNTVISKLDSE